MRATEITKSPPLQSFWKVKNKIKRINKSKIFHGKDWHRKTIEQIENHFLSCGCKIVREPTLYWGRADLGVYKRGECDLLIEVGTTSFYKLWINLEMSKNSIYLIVPNDDKLIEFICS